MDLKKLWTESNWLNNTTKPILFVAIYIIILSVLGDYFATLDYFTQFLVIGIPISFIIFYYFGKIHDGWLYLLGLFFVAQSWDLVLPPFAVSPSGQISTGIFMSGTSVDNFIGQTLFNMGIQGPLLFYMTYIIAFAILFTLGTILAKMSKKGK